jgi:hypothetical protein
VQAHINLGSCYREGQGVEKDLVMAFKCFKMASDKNSALGLCHVGYMYARFVLFVCLFVCLFGLFVCLFFCWLVSLVVWFVCLFVCLCLLE